MYMYEHHTCMGVYKFDPTFQFIILFDFTESIITSAIHSVSVVEC